jgi:all-trans-retinol 13,14-reductase
MYSPTEHSARRARAELPTEVDVVVVGAGLGGLVSAAYLARSGFTVAVLDGHYVAGGCATQFQRKGADGMYRFDVGVHYIGDCGPTGQIPSILRGVGVELQYAQLDPDGFDELIFPDFRFRVPTSLDLYRDRLVEQFPSEKKGIDRYVQFVREVMHIGEHMEQRGGRLGLVTAWEVLRRGRLLARYQTATIAEFLDSCTRDERLRAVMLGQHGDYGLPPNEVSALLHAGLAGHYFRGAFYPVGGGQIIADRLCDVIEQNGGSVHLRRPVDRILVRDGRAVGVRTEPKRGEVHEIRARTVVSNADIKRTLFDLLGPEHLPSELAHQAREWTMGGALFATFLGVEGDPVAAGMRAANYWESDSYDVSAMYERARSAAGIRTHGSFITSASTKDPTTHDHSPAGTWGVEVMTLVNGDPSAWGYTTDDAIAWKYRHNAVYEETKQRVEDELVARFQRLFPNAGAIVYRESASPLTHTRFTRASGGTAYGIAATPGQFMAKRPGYRGPVKGLYLCGASTRAGHGIVGSMMSGKHAAKRVLADDGKALS